MRLLASACRCPFNEEKGRSEESAFSVCFLQAQRRRAALQTSTLAREAALDFLPLDVDHDGFTATMEFLRDEQEVLLASVSRLMGDYAFLCDPFVPCASAREAVEVMELHGADGQWFSLSPLEGEARFLFYLPKNAASRTPPSPVSALERVMVRQGRCLRRDAGERQRENVVCEAGLRAESLDYDWKAIRANLRGVVEGLRRRAGDSRKRLLVR